MNATTPEDYERQDELEFRAALIAKGQLSPDSVDQIMSHVHAQGMSFADAAQRLGLVETADVEGARQHARASTVGEAPSLVEAAIRKLAGSRRDLVLRQNPPVKASAKLTIAHDAFSPHSEKVRALRTDLLLLCDAQSNAAVIAIVSAMPGEGRSLLAAELAVSFSQLGRNTLLIDGDLRKSHQHVLFGSPVCAGLSDALVNRERAPLHPVIDLPHLWLLAAGAQPTNPVEMLSDGRFQTLIQSLRREYDFIIIDTPPVTQYADALAIATIAGRAVFLTRAHHTSYAAAKNVLRRLDSTQAAIMGAVINHF